MKKRISFLILVFLVCSAFTTGYITIQDTFHCFAKDPVAFGSKRIPINERVKTCLKYGTEKHDGHYVEAIKEALSEMGFSPERFKVISCYSLDNAAALLNPYEYGGFEQVIIYDWDFLDNLDDKVGHLGAGKIVLYHELAHMLLNHTIIGTESRPSLELAADKFAGKMSYKQGICYKDVIETFNYLSSSSGSSTHPARDKRKQAFKDGWMEAFDNDPVLKEYEKLRDKARDNNNHTLAISYSDKHLNHSCYKDWSMLFLKANSLKVLKKNYKAIAIYKEAYKVGLEENNSLGMYFSLGWIGNIYYYRLNNYEKAAEYYTKAYKASPDNDLDKYLDKAVKAKAKALNNK